jgi:hypothetical protein
MLLDGPESDPTRDAPAVGCWPDQLSSDPFAAQPPPLQECQQKRPSPALQFAPKRWNLEAAGTECDSPQTDSSPVPGQQGQLLHFPLEYTCRHQRKHTCSEARITMQHDPAADFKSCNWLINGLLLTTFKWLDQWSMTVAVPGMSLYLIKVQANWKEELTSPWSDQTIGSNQGNLVTFAFSRTVRTLAWVGCNITCGQHVQSGSYVDNANIKYSCRD